MSACTSAKARYGLAIEISKIAKIIWQSAKAGHSMSVSYDIGKKSVAIVMVPKINARNGKTEAALGCD
jgi:hypothetical protein